MVSARSSPYVFKDLDHFRSLTSRIQDICDLCYRWKVGCVARDRDPVAHHGRLPSLAAEVGTVHGGVGCLMDEGVPEHPVTNVIVPLPGVNQ